MKVFFIDEGFFSNLALEHIRPLPKKYADKLPAQSIQCILGGVQPLSALKEKQILSFGIFIFLSVF